MLTFVVFWLYEGYLGLSLRQAAEEWGAGDKVGRKGVGEEEESNRDKQGGGNPGREGKCRRRRTQPEEGRGRGRAGTGLRPEREGPGWAPFERAAKPGAEPSAAELRPLARPPPTAPPPRHPTPTQVAASGR